MLPQFNLVVEDEYVEQFRDALGTVQVDGEPLRFKQSGGGFSLDFGQANLHDRPDAVTIAGETVPIASLGMETVEIEDRPGTTAYHVPEGILAVYDPAPRRPATAHAPRSPFSRSRRHFSRPWTSSRHPTWHGRPCSPSCCPPDAAAGEVLATQELSITFSRSVTRRPHSGCAACAPRRRTWRRGRRRPPPGVVAGLEVGLGAVAVPAALWG
jgi:hypothetical protein